MLSIKTKKLLAVAAFSLAFLITRIPFLGYDEINPDAVNWHFRSEQFIVGLKTKDFLKTYQHYHPGVTLMLTMGIPVEIYRQLNPQDRVYTEDNFIVQHAISKYALVFVQLALSVLLVLTLKDIVGYKKSLLTAFIFSLEPFFLGNSRLLHMDVLLTLLMFLSLTYAFNYHLHPSVRNMLLSGVFAGLSFLTKSVGALTIPVIFIFLVLSLLRDKENYRLRIKHLGIFLASCTAVIFILFPALWVNPKFVLTDIYNEGLRIGTRRGHEQIIMGEQEDIAGPSFYPLVLALKTSPLIWLGVGLFLFQIITNRHRFQSVDKKFLLLTAAFYLIYFLGMSVASKKLDRYMVPLFPFLGLVVSTGLFRAFTDIKGKHNRAALVSSMILVVGISILIPLFKLYPYYFMYTNPLFGNAESANRIVGQKPFGTGIWELKNLIVARYGKDVTIGFIDRKPMSMIYKNSKLFDIRETGTRKYDLIILGPNEEMPENVTGGSFKFEKDGAMIINGLEFWRFYKKV